MKNIPVPSREALLLAGFVLPAGTPDFTGISTDSRTIRPGDLFLAVDGVHHKGSRFVLDAVLRGAAGIAMEKGLDIDLPVPVLTTSSMRSSLARLAAQLYPARPETMVAVTGTNGKTSVAHLCRQLWKLTGCNSACIGTLGVLSDVYTVDGSLTTPDPLSLHWHLQALAGNRVTHVAMEASSHGLHQHRTDGLLFQAAAFTNLTRDHLDYHGTLDDYFAAKSLLFRYRLAAGGTAVLNRASSWYEPLAALVRERGCPVLSFSSEGHDDADMAVLDQQLYDTGQRLVIRWQGETWEPLDVPLAGSFQADNLLAALGLLLSTGSNAGALQAVIPLLQPIPGRLQRVTPDGHPFSAYVDYAHTPDALERALRTLRSHTRGRLWVVFGCGGNRDAGKRPLMGAVAMRGADNVIITDDNPRHDDAAAIRHQIRTACPNARIIPERPAAVRYACDHAETGDCVLVAGKGHETGQIVGDTVYPMNDVALVTGAIAGSPAE